MTTFELIQRRTDWLIELGYHERAAAYFAFLDVTSKDKTLEYLFWEIAERLRYAWRLAFPWFIRVHN